METLLALSCGVLAGLTTAALAAMVEIKIVFRLGELYGGDAARDASSLFEFGTFVLPSLLVLITIIATNEPRWLIPLFPGYLACCAGYHFFFRALFVAQRLRRPFSHVWKELLPD